MKKIIILVACIIAMHAASAQTSMVRQEPRQYENLETIIRHYGTNTTITCTNMRNGAVFIYSESPFDQTIEYALDGYYINDMVCENDTMFFCGYKEYDTYTRGILGFFRISDVFFNGDTNLIHVQDSLYVGKGKKIVTNLTRLVAYTGSNGFTRHMVCIGNSNGNYPCIVDFNPDMGGNYTGGYINYQKERFCDIKVVTELLYDETYRYLATVGFDNTFGDYLSLRIYNIDNVITGSAIQNDVFVFAVDTSSTREWYTDGALLTPVSNNNIATVSYRYHNNTNDGLANLNVSVFDVHKLVTGSLFPMVHNLEIYLGDTIYNRKLHRAIYKSTTQTLAFLHSLTNLATGNELSIFCEIDYTNITNPSTPRAYCRNDQLLQGMDNYNGMHQYVMSGYEKNAISTLRYEFEKFSLIPNCANTVNYISVNKPVVFAMKTTRPFNVLAFHGSLKEYGYKDWEHPIIYKCGE